MTNVVGTMRDSVGNALRGRFIITLSRSIVQDATTPDSVLTTLPVEVDIEEGVVDFELFETETFQVPYHIVFYDWNDLDNPLLDFYAIIPNVGTVEFGSLVPTGISNANLDTGAFQVARYITKDATLSSLIRPDYTQSLDFDSVDITTKLIMPKPFTGGLRVKNVRIACPTGFTDWVFSAGYVDSSGVDQDLTIESTVLDSVIGGRRWINIAYNTSLPDNILGVWFTATPGVGSGTLKAKAIINFTEI